MSRNCTDKDAGLGIWFRDDIKNALLAAYAAGTALAVSERSPEVEAFRRGFVSALVTIGLNFGILSLPFIENERVCTNSDLHWDSEIAESRVRA